MITYVYETIPSRKGGTAKHFEIRQGMNEAPLTKHPETGEQIRRVILGGYGILHTSSNGGALAACGCGKKGCCG